MARVRAGGRLHFGFRNLSTSRDRLFGAIGVAIDVPRTVVSAERSSAVDCPDPSAAPAVRRAVEHLGVPGAAVRVEEALPRHVGLGSGTQLALAAYAAIARAYGRDPDPREAAPALDRGRRSGVGVAAFERGGFVMDAGHPTSRVPAGGAPTGEWSVPAIEARRGLPTDWRFLLVLPEASRGRSGGPEDASMRAVAASADPGHAEEIGRLVRDRLLPAIEDGDVATFGRAVGEIGHLNGRWYAAEQGGIHRSPADAVVQALADHPAVFGADQSSWGPAVYGVTDATREVAAREAGRAALDAAGHCGTVLVARPRNDGARIEPPA